MGADGADAGAGGGGAAGDPAAGGAVDRGGVGCAAGGGAGAVGCGGDAAAVAAGVAGFGGLGREDAGGGGMEVEFVAQVLSLMHGVRGGCQNTAQALRHLAGCGALAAGEAEALMRADLVWRTVQSMVRITVGRGSREFAGGGGGGVAAGGGGGGRAGGA